MVKLIIACKKKKLLDQDRVAFMTGKPTRKVGQGQQEENEIQNAFGNCNNARIASGIQHSWSWIHVQVINNKWEKQEQLANPILRTLKIIDSKGNGC